jgi:hypothetical protein
MIVSTTTVTITRRNGAGDPYETGTTTTVATGVPAHIGAPTGSDTRLGGEREMVDAALVIDPTPALAHVDDVLDESTGEQWQVVWVRQREGFDLDHQRAGLRAVKGAA